MRWAVLSLAALALVAGCNKSPDGSKASRADTPPSSQVNTPGTPANAGTASREEKKEGANPVQGQVDPKAPEQQRDFQQKGQGAGPKPGG
jgi:hypothetical protein